MPQTRRAAKKSPVKLEAELESVKQLAESHRQKIETHRHQIALEEQRLIEATNKAKELEERKLKEEKAKERRRKQEEKELENRRNDTRKGVARRDADLPWERMSGKGICGECQSKDIDCYRVIEAADTRRSQPYVTNAMRVQIGKLVYSRCQECRLKDARCRVASETVAAITHQPATNGNASGPKKRKRDASPELTVRTRSRVKLEGVFIKPPQPRPQLPTPRKSSPPGFRVIPGSSSHFPIQLGTPGPSMQPVSGSQKFQALEKTIRTIQTEQRVTRECLENIMGRLGIRSATGVRTGGSPRQAEEDRNLSYVSESE